MSDERDWADLPAELIHLISKKLPDLCDLIRFRTVCKSWCSSAPLSDPPPQLPWLLESRYRNMAYLEEELRFCALSTGRIGIIRPEKPRPHKLYFSGPCCGYLLLTSKHWESDCVSLFNPLTNVDISLPPFEEYISCAWPVWTSSDPISSRTIMFVDSDPVIKNEMGCWAVYHPGKTDWIVTEEYYYDCCYWNGMFFSTLPLGCEGIEVFDGTSQKLLYNIPSPNVSVNSILPRIYVVELSGVIIRVCWYLDWDRDVEESIFRICKLNFEGRGGQPCWVEISNINNHMVFLDYKNAFSLKPIAGFRGNCIYFFNLKGNTPCRYDIADGTFERIPCPFKACTWFVPSLL